MNKQIYNLITHIVTTLNFNIAVVSIGGESEYFLYNKFIPSNSGGSQTIDYIELSGINITQFILTNTIDISNSYNLNSHFQSYIENTKELTIKFNKNSDYLLFSL